VVAAAARRSGDPTLMDRGDRVLAQQHALLPAGDALAQRGEMADEALGEEEGQVTYGAAVGEGALPGLQEGRTGQGRGAQRGRDDGALVAEPGDAGGIQHPLAQFAGVLPGAAGPGAEPPAVADEVTGGLGEQRE